MSNDFLHYPAAPVATKMAVSPGIGMLARIERKWLRKEAGIRTFAVVALMGTLSSLIGTGFIIMAMIGVCPLVTGLDRIIDGFGCGYNLC